MFAPGGFRVFGGVVKLAFCSDVHVGNHSQHGGVMRGGMNDRARMVLDVLDRAMQKAHRLGCGLFVVAGDLVDTDKPPPQMVRAIQDLMPDPTHFDEINMHVDVLLGNHDMTSALEGDHALGPFQDRAHVVDKACVKKIDKTCELIYIPFQPGPAEEWLPIEMAKLLGKDSAAESSERGVTRRILALHLGISDEDTPPFLVGADDSIHIDDLNALCEQHGIRRVFTGNWHDHRNWEAGSDEKPVDVHQIGTLCPTGWNNPGVDGYGYVAIYDTDTDEVDFIEIPGPRFIKALPIEGLADDDWPPTLKLLHESATKGNRNYLRMKCEAGVLSEMLDELGRLKEEGLVVEGGVKPEGSERRIAAAKAARAARKSAVEGSGLASYVKSIDMDEGVSREAVLKRLLAYLEKSSE